MEQGELEQKARITGLYRFREKGKPGERVEAGSFLADFGMEGDRYADGGSRQLTLLSGEAGQWMKEQPEPGLCFRRYKANLETMGLDLSGLEPGKRLLTGNAVLEVTEAAKECFPECTLYREGAVCRLSSGSLYLKVAESGEIRVGDEIRIADENINESRG